MLRHSSTHRRLSVIALGLSLGAFAALPLFAQPTPESASPMPRAVSVWGDAPQTSQSHPSIAETDTAEAHDEPTAPNAPTVAAAPLANPPLPSPVASASTDVDPSSVVAESAPITLSPNETLPLGSAAATPATNNSAQSPSHSAWMLNTILALGVVVAIILVLRVMLSKITGRPTTQSISPVLEVLDRISLAPRSQVVMVRVGQQILLLGDSPTGLRALAQINEPQQVADLLTALTSAKSTSISADFRNMMDRFNRMTQQDEEAEELFPSRASTESHTHKVKDQLGQLLAKVRLTQPTRDQA